MYYPDLSPHFQIAPAESILALSHTFEINYNNSIPQDPTPGYFVTGKSYKDWVSDEQNLEETLELLGSVCESGEFDLGTISLAEHSGRLVIVSEALQKRNDDAQWLSLLPTLLDELEWDSLGLITDRHSKPNHDIFVACNDLQKAGRVVINGHLTLVMLPEADPGYFPFTLRVKVTVSLTPAIYEPLRILRNTWTTIEDSQRRLLQFLYPDAALMPDSETVTNIPFFYSILGPAPHVQNPAADNAMQPQMLLPTLLPFQRRSVAWLLDREGKMVTPNGQVVEKPADRGNFSFWERIEEGNRVFFMHRLTGNLALTSPDESPALGAILAEEPGLGKTLEIISLILLNPASPDRHPGIKRWDPEANVEVKAVKVFFSSSNFKAIRVFYTGSSDYTYCHTTCPSDAMD
jgi:E3 ubiquitin-protein ligase SHPRH